MTTDTLAAALDYAVKIEDLDAILDVEDEMDAPADWDSGVITFDPYL